MAIAYGSAGSGFHTVTSSASLAPLCPATVDAGDILIAHICFRTNLTDSPSTPADWTLLYGPITTTTTTAEGRHWIYGKVAIGDEDGDAIDFGSPAVTYLRSGQIYRYTGRVSGTLADCVPSASFSNLDNETDPPGPTITTTIAGALPVLMYQQTDDNAIGIVAGATGGTWSTSASTTSSLGDDQALSAQDCALDADPGTVTGGSASTANDQVNTIGFEIRPNAPSVSHTDKCTGTIVISGTVSESHVEPITFTDRRAGQINLSGSIREIYAIATVINGGVAGENDAAPIGFPGIGYGRNFDDVDDEITCAIGSAGVTGAFTIAALFRSRGENEPHPIFAMHDGSNTVQLGLEIFSTASPQLRIGADTRLIDSNEAGAAGSVYYYDQWVIVAIAKAAGTAEPTFHVWKQSTATWVHVGSFGDLTIGNPGASTYVKFGRLGVTGVYADIDLGVAGVWNVELNSTQIEELSGGATQDWYDQSGPVALWDFNQANTATDVLDLVGSADQTAIVGTSVDGGPANPAWTYGIAQTYTDVVTGTITVSGASLESNSQTVRVAGSVQLSGTTRETYGVGVIDRPTGTVVLSGSIRESWVINAGIASEDDSAPAATVLQGFFRRFDGINDRVQVTNGEALLWGDLTMAALVRKQRDDQVEWLVSNVNIGGASCISIGCNASNQITMQLFYATTVRQTTALTLEIADGWAIVAVTKAAGTTTPRAHVWKQGSGWTHENMDGTLGNPLSQIDGYIEFASQGYIGGNSQIDLETVGEWQQNLSDAEVEELSANWATLDWFDHSVAVPCGLWNLNQSSPGTEPSETGIRDLSGGEAGPWGTLEGTTVIAGAPVRESDGKVWDPRTPLVGEKAHESDAAPAGTVLQTFTDRVVGTVVVSGTMVDQYAGATTDLVTGTITLSGTTREESSQTAKTTGTIIVTGTLSESWALGYTDRVTGTITLTGASREESSQTAETTGTILLSGFIREQYIGATTDRVSGTINLTGAVREENSRASKTTGTIDISGTVSESWTVSGGSQTHLVTGTIMLSGTPGESLSRSSRSSGTVTISGSASDTYGIVNVERVSGTITLTGAIRETYEVATVDRVSGTVTISGANREEHSEITRRTGTVLVSGTASTQHLGPTTDIVSGIIQITGTRRESWFWTATDKRTGTVTISGQLEEIFIPSGVTTDRPVGTILLSGSVLDIHSRWDWVDGERWDHDSDSRWEPDTGERWDVDVVV